MKLFLRTGIDDLTIRTAPDAECNRIMQDGTDETLPKLYTQDDLPVLSMETLSYPTELPQIGCGFTYAVFQPTETSAFAVACCHFSEEAGEDGEIARIANAVQTVDRIRQHFPEGKEAILLCGKMAEKDSYVGTMLGANGFAYHEALHVWHSAELSLSAEPDGGFAVTL